MSSSSSSSSSPQGVLGLLSAVDIMTSSSTLFFRQCYNSLGDLMDLLALVNSIANFPLYCLMSSQFRGTIRSLVGRGGNTASVVGKAEVRKQDVMKISRV